MVEGSNKMADKQFCLVVECTIRGERGVDQVHGPVSWDEANEAQDGLRERLWRTLVADEVTVTIIEMKPVSS
jgi:hypothetical protein